MADIAKAASIEPDAPVLEGVSRLAVTLWRDTWKHADKTAQGDAEALHDMRVAIRRLRSLLQNFEGEKESPVLTPSLRNELRDHRNSLSKLGDALGLVRDCDVLTGYLNDYAANRLKAPLDENTPGLLTFERHLQNRRAEAFAPMVKRINKSRRPQGLHEQFARWALGLPAAASPALSLSDTAHNLLAVRLDEIQDHADALDAAHVEVEQHELRKSLRRLRYTFETLGPCYADDVKPQIKTLVELQDLLGEMQDRAVLSISALGAFGVPIQFTEDGTRPTMPQEIPEDVAAFLKYGANRRSHLLGQVRGLWKRQQDEGFFEKLREL